MSDRIQKLVTKEGAGDLLTGLPDINSFRRKINQRGLVYHPMSTAGDHMAMTWVCLQDLAMMIQTAIVMLRKAILDFENLIKEDRDHALLVAVSETRSSFDYSALCMSAAANHLASAMWHFHEKAEEPLGEYYKTAGQVRQEWAKANKTYASLEILCSLFDETAWETLSQYRHSWSHRGIPVIGGEFRYARRELWQDENEPPPSTQYMAARRADRKIRYDSGNMKPDFQMKELLDIGRKSLARLHECAEEFLTLFDAVLDEQGGWSFNEDGKMSLKII